MTYVARKSAKEQLTEFLQSELKYLPGTAETVADQIEGIYAADRLRTVTPVFRAFQNFRAKVYRGLRENRAAHELAGELREIIDPPVPPKAFALREESLGDRIEMIKSIAMSMKEVEQQLQAEPSPCPKCQSPTEPWTDGELRCIMCNHVFPQAQQP